MALALDPIGTGLVESLTQPGGNVTGLSIKQPDTTANVWTPKEIEPDHSRLAI